MSSNFSGTVLPPGTCLIHGSYIGPWCPGCTTSLPPDQISHQSRPAPVGPYAPREWESCPVCQGSGKVYDPIMGMGSAGATMQCHRCLGTGTIERPR